MPAKRKTTPQTAEALRRLFDACDEGRAWPPRGLERTPGFTLGGLRRQHRNPEPVVWVLKRRLRIPDRAAMEDADALVTALWDTIPAGERRRSRLFVHCAACPVRFTKKGAIADARRKLGVSQREGSGRRAVAGDVESMALEQSGETFTKQDARRRARVRLRACAPESDPRDRRDDAWSRRKRA